MFPFQVDVCALRKSFAFDNFGVVSAAVMTFDDTRYRYLLYM